MTKNSFYWLTIFSFNIALSQSHAYGSDKIVTAVVWAIWAALAYAAWNSEIWQES